MIDITSDSESSARESRDSCIASEASEAVEVSPKRSKPRVERAVRRDTRKKSGLLHFCWSELSGGNSDRKITAVEERSSNFAAMDSATEGNAICVICQASARLEKGVARPLGVFSY